MKRRNKLAALLLIAAMLISGSRIALAEQGNKAEPHTHEYKITTFSEGVVSYKCKNCDETYSENFASRLNERGYTPLDVVEDGIINAKDYAYLIRHYDSFGPINGFDEGPGSDWETPGIDI